MENEKYTAIIEAIKRTRMKKINLEGVIALPVFANYVNAKRHASSNIQAMIGKGLIERERRGVYKLTSL